MIVADKHPEDIMQKHEETMTLGRFLEELRRYPEDAEVFFGCPDEANPLEFLGVEQGSNFVHVKFQLNVYKGRD
jgi:hypothetical protein